MAKTVYVLGAGFSREAGLPTQAGIMRAVQQLKHRLARRAVSLMDIPPNAVEVFGSDYAEPEKSEYAKLEKFIRTMFRCEIDKADLEDVFTLLDLSLAQGLDCGPYSLHDLRQLRDTLNQCILFMLHDLTHRIGEGPAQFYRSVAAYLLNQRIASGQVADPLTIVSLNWDAVLEESLYWCLEHANGVFKGDIDYCCYTTALSGSPHTPSILQKSKGVFNVKLIKLHGSANWLVCPDCSRLYTALGSRGTVWAHYVTRQRCEPCAAKHEFSKHIDPNLPRESAQREPAILRPFFITPTYLKIFDNVHIQMAWHNALLDIAEANKIVFIGYSLPEADYHVRALLRRAVRPNAEIIVVLRRDAEPRKGTPAALMSYYAAPRYREFFGTTPVRFELGGVRGYFESVMGHSNLAAQIRRLRRSFDSHNLPAGPPPAV